MIFCYNLPMFDADNILRFAREVIDIETQAVSTLKERLDQNFAQACAVILQAKGKVVVSGMGKSVILPENCSDPSQHRHTFLFHAPGRGKPRRSGHALWR